MPSIRPDPDRTTGLATAAGISVAAAAAVGAVAAAGRAVRGRRGELSRPPAAEPEAPELPRKPSFGYLLWMTAREFISDQCLDMAASLVFFAVLALGPSILVVVAILGLLSPGTITNVSQEILQPALPSSTFAILDGLIKHASSAPGPGIGLAVGLLGAVWSASGYIGAFGRAMNRIYDIPEGRPAWKRRPTQIAVTLLIVVLVVIGALLIVSNGPIVTQLASTIGIGDLAFATFQIVKWPVLVALAVVGVAVLYYFSPNVQQPRFRWISSSSALALLIWAIATVGFGLYVNISGGSTYSRSYGPIAGAVIFLLWLLITNMALLYGAEFDAEVERSRELQAGIAAEERIQLPMRDTRVSDRRAARRDVAVVRARELRVSRGERG